MQFDLRFLGVIVLLISNVHSELLVRRCVDVLISCASYLVLSDLVLAVLFLLAYSLRVLCRFHLYRLCST